jgi:hypothetical protein
VIERLKETGGMAFGFKVTGRLSEKELQAFERQLEFFFAQHKNYPIGILADLTQMRGAEWKARCEDLHFLAKHTGYIARMAVVGASPWEELVHRLTAGAALLQSEMRYFKCSEIRQAWRWVRTTRQTGDKPDACVVHISMLDVTLAYSFYSVSTMCGLFTYGDSQQ